MVYKELKQKEQEALELACSYRTLAEQAKQAEVKKQGITAWLGYTFESSSRLIEEFAEFSRLMRLHLKKTLAPEFELVSYNRGHFDFSAFFKHLSTGKLVYLLSSDVRYSPDSWYNNLLVRTAKHEKDYTGGSNCYTSLETLKEQVLQLIK